MFGKTKKAEKVTVVTTKEQLKAAVKRKDSCIEVQGELVKKMKWMTEMSPGKTAAIITCLTAAAAPAAVSTVAPPAALLTAPALKLALITAGAGTLDAASIITIVGILGVVIVIAILRDYDVELKDGDKSLRLISNK